MRGQGCCCGRCPERLPCVLRGRPVTHHVCPQIVLACLLCACERAWPGPSFRQSAGVSQRCRSHCLLEVWWRKSCTCLFVCCAAWGVAFKAEDAKPHFRLPPAHMTIPLHGLACAPPPPPPPPFSHPPPLAPARRQQGPDIYIVGTSSQQQPGMTLAEAEAIAASAVSPVCDWRNMWWVGGRE